MPATALPAAITPAASISYLATERCALAPESDYDPQLEQEVLRFSRLPPLLAERFRQRPLVLHRHIATPNREMVRFLSLAAALGRLPLILTMPGDRFLPDMNATKRRLAKLPIETGPCSTRCVTIVPFNTMRGAQLADVRCHNGSSLVQFHLDLLAVLLGSVAVQAVVDGTPFWREQRPSEIYPRLFALFTCFGVLAESYARDGPEASFTETVVLPSLEATTARFGIAPRIMRLLPPGEELESSWEHYPPEALPYALRAAAQPSS